MAVNKNFVVKNALEVNTNLLLADADNSRVGVGTSVPSFTLHVFGGIGVTDVSVTGVTTLSSDLKVGSGGTGFVVTTDSCLLYTSPSPRDLSTSRMPSSA